MKHETILAEQSTTYIFGYGSLMNPHSLARTLPTKRHAHEALLDGYKRKVNAPVGNYVYMNIVESSGSQIEGVLIAVSSDELALLEEREVGYEKVDVTDRVRVSTSTPSSTTSDLLNAGVFAFIAPDRHHADKKVLRSYLHTCALGVANERRAQWLAETEIHNDIVEDLDHPLYKNV